MPTDPWPDEPDEFDPEDRWGDPEADPEDRWGDPETELVEKITIPEPSEPELSAAAVDSAVTGPFWASVVLVNLAVFALSLGPMLIFFRGEWLIGLGLVGGGTLALARTYHLYRQFKRSTADRGERADGDEDAVDASREGERANTDTAAESDAAPERNP
ncbi:hypothetical protein SAMN04487948_102190 [Halogranum amylolyticum]|uniref:DUF7322 domain-containing protein n=1 Tax=Halogranum amylolyticum TaxID=660520 RepID=A0A1H8PAG1_9EURY|nr:hypothetical protein [Halogranum amylolyticum]SEO38969.1 hypothetical protein SAMN04487948_102190 [Halogranum amylolyticum]